MLITVLLIQSQSVNIIQSPVSLYQPPPQILTPHAQRPALQTCGILISTTRSRCPQWSLWRCIFYHTAIHINLPNENFSLPSNRWGIYRTYSNAVRRIKTNSTLRKTNLHPTVSLRVVFAKRSYFVPYNILLFRHQTLRR